MMPQLLLVLYMRRAQRRAAPTPSMLHRSGNSPLQRDSQLFSRSPLCSSAGSHLRSSAFRCRSSAASASFEHFQARRTSARRQKMRQIKETRPLSDSIGSVSNSRLKKTSQTRSRKCQYTAHNSMLKRTSPTVTPRHTLSMVLPKATRPPNKCSPCTPVIR